MRICSIHLFLIAILSRHSTSSSQGTILSPPRKVDLLQVTTLVHCDYSDSSLHVVEASGGGYLGCCTLCVLISLLICCSLAQRKRKAAATKLEADIWLPWIWAGVPTFSSMPRL